MTTLCRLYWNDQTNSVEKWDEVCDWAIKHFGKPGDRFFTRANTEYMDFGFPNDELATMFSLRWNAETIPEAQQTIEFVGGIINGF